MRLFVFGLGYTASRIATAMRQRGWVVAGTGGNGIAFNDEHRVRTLLSDASHVLSSVPPVQDEDPVLSRYGDALSGKWLGYLSSTGVYGDTGGAWVDEGAPLRGRRGGRVAADLAWQTGGARIFRLPGIYGPARSALDRVADGKAHRLGLADQVFSRIHVDDIVSGVIAGLDAPPGVYNLADDLPCSQDQVVEAAASLLGLPVPPIVPLDALSPAARAFYSENRRIGNGKAKRVLGWAPAYPDFISGLRALSATSSPAITRTPPAAASQVQR